MDLFAFYMQTSSLTSTICEDAVFFFFQCVFLVSLSKFRCLQVCALCLGLQFDSIDQWSVVVPILCCFFVTIALQHNLKLGMSPAVLLLFRIVLAILGFVFPYRAEIFFFNVCGELCWNFHRNCIESADCFWQDDHFYYIKPSGP